MLKLIKIIAILLFLVSTNFAQFSKIGSLFDDSGVTYDTDAQTYFDATSISKTQKDRINTFVVMLKDSLGISSLSDKFDIIYLLANEDSVSSKLNLVGRSFDAVVFPIVTFTQWEGWASDGITGYMKTSYNFSTNSTTFTQNLGSVGIYSRTNSALDAQEIGYDSDVRIIPRFSNGVAYFSVNSAQSSIPNDNSSGLITASRTASNKTVLYRNADSLHTSVEPSAVLTNNICYLQQNGGGIFISNRQLSFAFVGGGLTTIEVRKLYNCVEAYLDGIGAGINP